MSHFKSSPLIILAFLCFRCSTTQVTLPPYPSVELTPLNFEKTQVDFGWISPGFSDTLSDWIPRYVSTGVSSGIMVEFTGFKTDKPVNAKYSFIEIAEADSDTTFSEMRTQINDLRQAFFTVPPGRYIVRHVTTWADQRFFRDVVVTDGSYSIVSVTVLIPPTPR